MAIYKCNSVRIIFWADILFCISSSSTGFELTPLIRLTVMEYMCHKWPRYVPLIVNPSRSFLRSWLIIGFVTRLTRRLSLVEHELLTLSEHLSSPPVCSWVRVTRSLVLYVCFVDRCLSFCTFSFGHCFVCSSIYGFWLALWYLQTIHTLQHQSQ
jgi:hypothetical protein